MTTVIIPVDFSKTAVNAAQYAASLFKDVDAIKVILYHSYEKASAQAGVQKKLDDLKNELSNNSPINFETLAHEGDDFIDELERAVRHRSADMVLMGITERNAIGQLFMGSNALRLVERKVCPVLVIPEKATFAPIANAMFPAKFNDSLNATPSVPIKKLLDLIKPALHIVNVDPEHYIAINEHYEKEKDILWQMFSAYNPEFHFMRMYDVEDAIKLFVEERNIDLIILVQHNHSFFENLFKRSRTYSLSHQSNKPMFIVHE